MNKIYLDNASTSFPKPKQVVGAMCSFMEQKGYNINRGGYEGAYESAQIVYETREKLCRLFDFSEIRNVIFTLNVTQSLNMILQGLLQKGDHIIVSAMEHNAVMRPVIQLEKKGIEFQRFPCTEEGSLMVSEMESCLRPNTKAVVITAASNVCGTTMPLALVGEFCKKNKLIFIVDAAQSAGVEEISMEKMQIDILAFTGHKSLLGPQGVGGFLIREEIVPLIPSIITGGTGSFSDQEETPIIMPDKYEAGTMNLPGIYGLHAALSFLEEVGVSKIKEREMKRTKEFLDGIDKIPGIRVIGKKGVEGRTAVVSIQSDFCDEATLAFRLDQEYGIMTRVGLHCAPNAHKTLGTFPRGTVRFSFGYFTTAMEIEAAIDAIQEICQSETSI